AKGGEQASRRQRLPQGLHKAGPPHAVHLEHLRSQYPLLVRQANSLCFRLLERYSALTVRALPRSGKNGWAVSSGILEGREVGVGSAELSADRCGAAPGWPTWLELAALGGSWLGFLVG